MTLIHGVIEHTYLIYFVTSLRLASLFNDVKLTAQDIYLYRNVLERDFHTGISLLLQMTKLCYDCNDMS
jgi:hypothetical protein